MLFKYVAAKICFYEDKRVPILYFVPVFLHLFHAVKGRVGS